MNVEDVTIVRVGKSGVTDAILSEIDNILKVRGIVKIKLLKNFRESFDINSKSKENIALELAKNLGAEVVGMRGYTITLKRPIKKARMKPNSITRR
ncbi:MAG: YhbY family RNA-binding protein [Thermofilaceae archaeon]|nr:YhbY family RNA-binding protein [Thermofilaceae archaeon]MCX8180810.1 YhbY family RNA-binding protein [Thermofilaceae archaeon]MDW8004596.1 YhbY family RNA-binding protein [Thermofilaceae archaeon]